MYEALLKAKGVATFPAGSRPTDIVLVEAAQDATAFAAIRHQNSDAVIIACGMPSADHGFDEVARTPEDLMRAVHAALGQAHPNQEIAA